MADTAHHDYLERRRADLAAREDAYTQAGIVMLWHAQLMERSGEPPEDVAKVYRVSAWLRERARQLVLEILAIDDELEKDA
jgi:hypothetical protein